MYRIVRPWLFRLDPEFAHQMTINLLRLTGAVRILNKFIQKIYLPPEKWVKVFGLSFKNPLGLAAGYDKDGQALQGLAGLGFGHLEIGTVTLQPQPGNPKPRIFRLEQDRALINRMGFPGKGADYVQKKLKQARLNQAVIGVNIGKNRDTLLQDAPQEYAELVEKFAPHVDYLSVNVSSPNTVGLRRLQSRSMLEKLLGAIADTRRSVVPMLPKKHLPILVKLSPDLTLEELEDALEIIQSTQMDGVIATNTTLSRENLSSPSQKEVGGLSGRPLFLRSLESVRLIVERTHGQLPVVGVGGILSYKEAQTMLDAGAKLIQVYTGLIYTGPGLVKEIVSRINY